MNRRVPMGSPTRNHLFTTTTTGNLQFTLGYPAYVSLFAHCTKRINPRGQAWEAVMIGTDQIGWKLLWGNGAVFALAIVATLVFGAIEPALALVG